MKKLMFAAFACAGISAFAGIESANIVGYQQSALNNANFTSLIVPFTHVNGDGKGLMLNQDLYVADPAGSDDPGAADQIRVWEGNGYHIFFLYDDGDPANKGWSDYEDKEWAFFEDNYPNGLPEAAGIFYKSVGDPKTIQGSGEVESKDEVEFPLPSGNFARCGNPYPTPLFLNTATQFTMPGEKGNDDPGSADQVRIWEGNGYHIFFLYDDGDPANKGWSDYEDKEWGFIEDTAYPNGLPSGTGLFFKTVTGTGKSAVFQSPLKK